MILYLVITFASLGAAALVGMSQRKGLQRSGCSVPPRGTRARSLYQSSLLLLFLLLAVPSILRQACGNDYMRYVEFFHLADVGAYVPTEPGFNVLVRLLYGLCGYENYLLVFAVFSVATLLFFLSAIRQQADYFAGSFAVFMLSGYYFQTYNTVRYYLALAMALFALRFFLERQYLPFLALVLLAASFHKSVLCVLVLYPLAVLPWRRWQAILLGAAGTLLTVFRTEVMAAIVRLYPSYEDTSILAQGGSPSWPNILRCSLILVLYLVCRHLTGAGNLRTDRRFRFCRNAVWLSLYIYVFAWFVPEISRIAYYLVITQIFFVPELIALVPPGQQKWKKRLTILTGLACAVIFAVFLFRAYDVTIRILPYKSFLFHDLPSTPSRSIY